MRFFYTIILIVICFSCGKNKSASPAEGSTLYGETVFCGAENQSEVAGKQVYKTSVNGTYCGNGETQSPEAVRSGKNAVKLDEKNKYGFGLILTDLKPGNFIRASVWQKVGVPNGTLVVGLTGPKVSFSSRTFYHKVKTTENGWVEHNLSLIVTPGITEANVYVFSGGKVAYFDDLNVELFDSLPKNNFDEKIELFLNQKSSRKIQRSINDAASGPVILDKHKKYVKGIFVQDTLVSKVKLKLKGDWTDHLTSGKVSCRIKMKGEGVYKQKKTFSLHHPSTRNYIDEWLTHKIAEQEDVLTTTYEFTNVSLNGVNLGLYAMEEHFEKQLLESRNRREGPILKFDETGMWNLIYEQIKNGDTYTLPYYDASVISVFKKKKVFGDQNLLNGFLEGTKLLQLYKEGYLNIEEIFDLEQMAKFHVILDITGGSHAVEWHNRRFYFNPVTQKLEQILYDVMPFDNVNVKEFLLQRQFADMRRTPEGSLDLPFILNEQYQAYYLKHLDRMTAPAYWESLYEENQIEIGQIEAAIKVEEPNYEFSSSKFIDMASYLREHRSEFRAQWEAVQSSYTSSEDWVNVSEIVNIPDSLVISGVSLNAYFDSDSTVPGYLLQLENYHYTSIEICGYERENWPGHAVELEKKTKMGAFEKPGDKTELRLDFMPTKLFFKAKNRPDRYFETKIIEYPKPTGPTYKMSLEKSEGWRKYCSFNDNHAVLKSGEISELICFPKDVAVVIPKGTKIDFKTGGGIIVQKSLDIKGIPSSPVELFSSDSSSVGLTVLEADFVRINQLSLNGLSCLKYRKWELTGALTIYESPTLINGLTINGARCEDALNIIRSHFTIGNLNISDCASDAFDADFCTGTLDGAVFRNSGNDCIDFSGSEVSIKNIDIYNCGDKGISGGERSVLELFNIYVEGAVTGIASKDQSMITAERVGIKNAEYNLMAFRKKSEYGPAFLFVVDDDFEQSSDKIVVDLNSVITINDKKFKGAFKIDVEKLYERF